MTAFDATRNTWISSERELVRMELVALASEVATLAWRAREQIEQAALTAEAVDLLEECSALEWTARELLSRQGTFQKGSEATLQAALELFRACRRDANDILQLAESLSGKTATGMAAQRPASTDAP